MKQLWIRLSTRVDALSLRERMMIFAAAIAALVFGSYALVFDPMTAEKELLASTIAKQQSDIGQIEQQISLLAKASGADPDAPNRARLAALRGEALQLSAELRSMQESLVQPERIAPLLETMLRSNGKLRLVALQTLPVTGLSEALPAEGGTAGARTDAPPVPTGVDAGVRALIAEAKVSQGAPPVAPAGRVATVQAAEPKQPELVYRHGVEITLQGRYVDMVEYMAQLERMPVRLIWGRARLDARSYPDVRLTLTLFTLSLEKEWMKL